MTTHSECHFHAHGHLSRTLHACLQAWGVTLDERAGTSLGHSCPDDQAGTYVIHAPMTVPTPHAVRALWPSKLHTARLRVVMTLDDHFALSILAVYAAHPHATYAMRP